MLLRALGLLGLLLSTACATITQSPSQNVTVVTEPPGATCTLTRNGVGPMGTVNPTPGTLRVGRSVRALDIACTREGYQPAQQTVESRTSPVFLANVLVGGVVGLIVDASTSASTYYPDSVTLTLSPIAPPAAAPAPPAISMEPIPDAPVRRRAGGRPMS
ncbi:hypothetical protein ACE7GA_07510 [Roseomonas sp. CCTCC AB2023176]|uniref:hypothetical protein n=1 Tax=Roseomonas sp. CCTCC AB2023176 TaxID=3342640 RepID=UPI0035E34173